MMPDSSKGENTLVLRYLVTEAGGYTCMAPDETAVANDRRLFVEYLIKLICRSTAKFVVVVPEGPNGKPQRLSERTVESIRSGALTVDMIYLPLEGT
jgi:hypothetical protein